MLIKSNGLFVLFMLGASIAPKFLMTDMVAEQSMTPLGWPAKYLMLIGLIELACGLRHRFVLSVKERQF